MKKVLLALVIAFGLAFINGCFYVLKGQHETMEKILAGEKVTLYEKCSIYTMHMAVYLFGWPLSPEASGEVFRMSFPWNREKTVLKENDYFIEAPTIQNALKNLPEGERKKISFHGDIAYNTANPDHRVALAVNPGILYRKGGKVYLKSYAHYPYYSRSIFTVCGVKIIIHEGLFHYLEKIHWIHPYTMIWWCNENNL